VKTRLTVLAAGVIGLLSTPALHVSANAATLSIPNQLESAINVNRVDHTVTLPLYKGAFGEQRVWFVITESSDLDEGVRGCAQRR
jgi:hypothetical protein